MPHLRTRPTYQGLVVWTGPSQLDGQPIVVIATGYHTYAAQANRKLGPTIQLWIVPEDLRPHDALISGADASVCGDCELRGEGDGRGRGCYVHIPFLTMIWKAYQIGSYDLLVDVMERVDAGRDIDPFWNKTIRIGSYGDPAAVPLEVWELLASKARRLFGYTRQWRRPDAQALRALVMASCFTAEEREQARALGWRTFRGVLDDAPPAPGEITCPHVSHGTTCFDCGLCSGTFAGDSRADITVPVHGAERIKNAYRRAASRASSRLLVLA